MKNILKGLSVLQLITGVLAVVLCVCTLVLGWALSSVVERPAEGRP